jgi:hypothetical protein
MRILMVAAALWSLLSAPVRQIVIPPPDHSTVLKCYPPSVLVGASPQDRGEYLECLGAFIDEQQRAIEEHARAASGAIYALRTFAAEDETGTVLRGRRGR